MALPVDVAGPHPRPGDVGAPPKLGSDLSSVAEAESEPLVSGGAEFAVFRVLVRVRALGSGGAEFAVFRVFSPSPSPGVGRSRASYGAFGKA